RAKEGAVSGTPKLTLNGIDYAVTLTTSPATYRKSITTDAYPSSAAAIGMVSSGTADDTFLYECGVIVAYVTSRDSETHRLGQLIGLSDALSLNDSPAIGHGLGCIDSIPSFTDACLVRLGQLVSVADTINNLADTILSTLGQSRSFADD